MIMSMIRRSATAVVIGLATAAYGGCGGGGEPAALQRELTIEGPDTITSGSTKVCVSGSGFVPAGSTCPASCGDSSNPLYAPPCFGTLGNYSLTWQNASNGASGRVTNLTWSCGPDLIWSACGIPLEVGPNRITVTLADRARSSQDAVTIVREGSAGTVVYDNTFNDCGYVSPAAYDKSHSYVVGNLIALAGAERYVTGIDVSLYSLGDRGLVDAKVRFFQPDATGVAPGALLWQGGVSDASYSDFKQTTFVVPVPSVLVPDKFFWTIELTNVRTGNPPGWPVTTQLHIMQCGPARVGTGADGAGIDMGAGWTRVAGEFAARITARAAP